MAESTGEHNDHIDRFASNYGAWPHQVEALRKAIGQNLIVNAPTGTGKTLIACMLLDACKDGASQGLFVVNSRALVSQQGEYLRRNSQEGLTVAELGGEGAQHAAPDVIVATAETLRVAIERGQILVEKLNVVVFDEAHYVVGNHPYAEIAKVIWERAGNPRILGLTASFLHGALVDPEQKKSRLESLLRAELIAPTVIGPQTEHRFYSVPWCTGNVLDPCEIAEYCDSTDNLLKNLRSRFDNWELYSAIEKEKSRARGVIDGLGALGWYHFMRGGLTEVVKAKLMNKLTYTDEPVIQSVLQEAVIMLPQFTQELAMMTDSVGSSGTTTGKCECLIVLLQRLLQGTTDKVIIFVERVSLAGPMTSILAQYYGGRIVHVCGVQAMDDGTRKRNLALFRNNTTQILVATTSLEEGLDVPSCRYVVRYDWFASAKSHVQGAGRARHPDAEVYYFENDPFEEEARRQVVESVAKGLPVPEQALAASTGDSAYAAGVGTGHKWGAESTMWDYSANGSFRGASCPCGARVHITSRAFGRGRKKKERVFSLEGPEVCPRFNEPQDPRFIAAPPETEEDGASVVASDLASEASAPAASCHTNAVDGEGEGHDWGDEKTIWDKKADKSFRGKVCLACGAHLHIASRASGAGGKTKERFYSVVGANVCPGVPATTGKASNNSNVPLPVGGVNFGKGSTGKSKSKASAPPGSFGQSYQSAPFAWQHAAAAEEPWQQAVGKGQADMAWQHAAAAEEPWQQAVGKGQADMAWQNKGGKGQFYNAAPAGYGKPEKGVPAANDWHDGHNGMGWDSNARSSGYHSQWHS